MKINNKGWIHRLSQAVIIFLVLALGAINLGGCTYKTYTGNIGDAKFSFQYRKNDCVTSYDPYSVNPYNSYLTDSEPQWSIRSINTCFSPDSRINVHVYGRRGLTNDAWISLDLFLAYLSNNKYLKDFAIRWRGTVVIAGMTAEYAYYYYEGFTTIPVYYMGKAVSFVYGDYIVDIDVLFTEYKMDTDIAFDLIVDTFEILE